MMNEGKIIYMKTTEKSFVDARVNGNLLLVHLKQEYGKDRGEMIRFDDVMTIVEMRLRKKTELIKFGKIEGLFETDYYYIFLLK